jgi:hypothetical protein
MSPWHNATIQTVQHVMDGEDEKNEPVSHDIISTAHLATGGWEQSWQSGGARAVGHHGRGDGSPELGVAHAMGHQARHGLARRDHESVGNPFC